MQASGLLCLAFCIRHTSSFVFGWDFGPGVCLLFLSFAGGRAVCADRRHHRYRYQHHQHGDGDDDDDDDMDIVTIPDMLMAVMWLIAVENSHGVVMVMNLALMMAMAVATTAMVPNMLIMQTLAVVDASMMKRRSQYSSAAGCWSRRPPQRGCAAYRS